MKFRRLFAAILSALMICSCFSFTASAQDTQTITNPLIAVQTAKADGRYNADNGALTKTKLYDAVNDTIFYRFTPVASAGTATTKLDNHGLSKVTVTNGVCYMAIELRSNYPVEPFVKLYNTTGVDGNAVNGTNCYTMTAASGEEDWERIVIKIEHSNLATFTQNHFYLFSPNWTTATNTPADAYVDIAAFAYFNDEYSALNYDFSSAVAADGAVTFSIDGEETDVAPESDPEVEGKFFMGWSADENATSNYESLEALTTIPTEDTTYYAILTGAVEDEKAVYISAAGDDNNTGRHSKTPVLTLAKAMELIAGDGIDTLYVVGDVDGTGTPGIAAKKIYIKGYSGKGSEVLTHTGHWKFGGDVEFSNITLADKENDDGQFMAQGHDIVFNDTVNTAKTQRISQAYYANFNNIDSTVDINGGSWLLFFGPHSGSTITGKATYNIDGNANISSFKIGKRDGYTYKGESYVNVNGGTVKVAVSHDDGAFEGTHIGLRYFTLNGGTVTSAYTRSGNAKATLEGVSVFEFNEGVTITPETIGASEGASDDSETRVVIFNNGVTAKTVEDTGAYVLDVTGGSVKADVSVAEDYTATLNGFTFELDKNYYNAVKIGDSTIKLETLTKENFLPVDLFAVGVNNVEFVEVDAEAMTAVYVSDSGDDNNKGNLPTAPVKTFEKVNEILAANETVETVYVVGTLTATGELTIGRSGIVTTIEGYTGTSDAIVMGGNHFKLGGDVVLRNIKFSRTSNDGGIKLKGYNLTIGENVVTEGGSTQICQDYYGGNINDADGSVVTVKSGTWGKITYSHWTNSGYTGNITHNISGNARVNNLTLGHGYGTTQTMNGTYTLNLSENAVIANFDLTSSKNKAYNEHNGAALINVNGGEITKFMTTHSFDGCKNPDVLVLTVNDGKVGEISKGSIEDKTSTRVVIFNDGVDAVTVSDDSAYVIDAISGNVFADVTGTTSTATLNKFTFTTDLDGVRITAGDTASEYDVAELNGEISLDKLTKGAVNEVKFFLKDEPGHIADYRADGYEIVYVAAEAAGAGDGSSPENAYGDIFKAWTAKASTANTKVVLALVTDEDSNSCGSSWYTPGAGSTVVITSAGGALNLNNNPTFGPGANIIFDNIHIANLEGEKVICGAGSNVTLTSTVTTTKWSTDESEVNGTTVKKATGANISGLYVMPGLDGTTEIANQFGSAPITVTVNNPYTYILRAGGYNGLVIKDDIKYVINEGAYVENVIPGGHATKANLATNLKTVSGSATVDILGGQVGKLYPSNAGVISGNLVVNVNNGGKINNLQITPGHGHGRVLGTFVTYLNDGEIGAVTLGSETNALNYFGKRVLVVNDNTADVPASIADGALTHVISYSGNGTVAFDFANSTMALTPAEGVKYVRITNGTDVKEYNVAGEEVELMADLSAIALAAGTTTVEFLTEGTEKPENVTLKFFANLEDDEAEAWLTKTVEYGATNDVFPIQSDKGRETAGSNDIFAYPDNANGHFLGWSTDKTADNIVVRETYTATADDEFYAIWEALDLLTAEEITVTNVVTADDFVVPEGAEKFEHKKVDGAFTGITTIFNADGTEYKAIGTGEKYPGLGGANTTINSYVGSLGSETATVLFPAGSAMYPIWMKFNDGKVIGAKTALEGEVNVAFIFNASPSDATARGFYISAGDVAGTYNMTPANKAEGGSTEFVVTLKTTVEAGDLIAYAAPYNFDNKTVKAAQLEAIYVWKDAPVVTTANAIFDANGGAWADDATTKTVETTIGEIPVAPTEAPEKAGFTFKGWDPALTAMTAEGATYKAVWEEIVVVANKVYLSDNGNDENDGLTADKPVKTLAKANSVMAANEEINTVVIVGCFTTNTNNNQWGYTDNIGVAGRNITITGDTAAATLDYSTGSDNCLGLLCNATFKNITIKAHGNDGTTKLNGFKAVYGEGVTMVDKKAPKIVAESGGAQLEINGGTFSQLLAPGITGSGTVNGDVTYVVNGGHVDLVSIGKAYRNVKTHNGKYIFTLNGGSVTEISLRGNGNNAANAYSGLRYFTINDGTVGKIVTTSTNKYGADLANSLAENKRTGVTVFEINKKGALTGTADLNNGVADESKRIIIFNNGAFEEGKVLDTGAFTANVIGGAIKADVTVAADYTTTLNGYTFEAADEEYDRVTITPATGEEKTYVLSEIAAIPAADLVAGTNKVVFFKYVEEAAEVDVVFDANGGAWADGETTKVVKTLESEIPVAPAEAPAQAGFTFKGWTPELAPVTAEGATYKAVWEKIYTKIYISNDGADTNDGLTAETPVKTLAKANTLLAGDTFDTLVVVGTITTAKDGDVLGVAGKTITVTGNEAGAVFDYDNNKSGTDDDLVLAGNIIFKNIAIYEGSGDGTMQARGNTVTFGEGITLAKADWPIEVVGYNGSPTINIESGSYGRVFPGTMSGTYNGGTTTINISGGTVSNLGLGWGWRGTSIFNGTYHANINGGTVKLITLRSGGDTAANTYRGLRYYTINDGIVESIVTTGGSQFYNNGTVAARTGATVFEINKAGVVTGSIALGANVITKQPEADESTRIILFNNNSYKAGQVTDTGAITVEVRNGAIKADVTMAADYATTLNGYTFTTDKAKVNINGTNYDVASLGGKIGADKLAEGYNLVIFTDVDIAPVKWVIGDTETEDYAEVGGKLTAPAVNVPAPTKDNYYTFEGWKIGEEPVDFETYTVPAEGATLTAVLTAHEMPLEAVKNYESVYAMNNGKEFTSEKVAFEGVDGVKAIYSTNTADHTKFLTFEGWNGWPTNNSVTGNSNFINTGIYKYAAVKYYYVPGTNTEARNIALYAMGVQKESINVMETGKWTYAVFDVSGTAISNQFHLKAANGVNIGTLVANNEVFYVDTLTVFQNAPTVATITFKAEDGATLYAIDAINGEAVAFYGDAPTKDNHTFLGWAIEGTTDVVDSFAFTADTTLVPVFEENEPAFPTTAQYKTYGIYDELAGTYTVELKIAGGVFNQGAFGFNFPTEQMTFVSATANEEAGIKFLTGTPVTETDKEGYYAAAWYATEDIDGKADASAAELTLVTFEFTMTPEQRAAFVAANATLTEYVNAQPDDAEAFAKYHNGTNYLVAPHEAGPSIERQAVVYMGHVDEVEENAVEYRTYGTYDAAKGTYSIDVKVIGGKFNLGAFGLAFDSQYMTYDPEDESALVLAEDIANYLGVTLANTAEGVAFVWDGSKIEGAGYVDATDTEVLIATIKTTMTPEQREAFVLAQMPMSTLAIDNADYFANGNYLVRPYTNGLDTPKVEAVYASHSDDEAEITTAAVTVKVTFAGKTGATAANIGYISVDGAEAVAIDAAGNTEATVEYVIADAVIGDEIELEIFKNGYIGATVNYTVQATANVIEITTIPGDIKGTADALCGDGKVSLDDFVRIIRAFDSAASDDYKASVDLDESGAVNVTDIGLIKTNFGKTTDDVTVVINGQAQ